MERTAWTDERLDERMAAIDQTLRRLDATLDALSAEVAGLRSDLMRIGFGLVGVLTAAMTAVIVAVS